MYSRSKVIAQLSWQVFASWAFHASTVKHLSAVLAGFAWMGSLWAGPSELNFQGVLLDSAGNGVAGTRAMTVKLYDAAIGGNLLYTEDLGNVAVNKGVYSFNFGTNGTGNAKVTETVAITDGTSTSFQKILSSTSVVTGSVTVTDGTNTWNQASGSSDGGVNFDANYSSSLRRITVLYYNGSPSAGKIVQVTYRSPSAGIVGILSNENPPWLEISVAGITQSSRQKLNSVPFALTSERASLASTLDGVKKTRSLLLSRFLDNRGYGGSFFGFASLPFQYSPPGGARVNLTPSSLPSFDSGPISLPIPCKITGIKASMVDSTTKGTGWYYSGHATWIIAWGYIRVTFYRRTADGVETVLANLDSGEAFNGGALTLSQSLSIDYNGDDVFWCVIESPYSNDGMSGEASTLNGQLKINWVKVEFEQTDLK